MIWNRHSLYLQGLTKRVEKHLVYRWLVIIGVIVGVFAAVRGCSEPSQTFEPTKVAPPWTQSFGEYLHEIDKRSDRFLEKEDFIKASVGAEVEWTVRVADVETIQNTILLAFWEDQAAPEDRKLHFPGLAHYSVTDKARLYSLRKEDRVIVKGVLKESLGTPYPIVDGSSIELIPQQGVIDAEKTRREQILNRLRQEYILSHDNLSPALLAGTEQPPKEWVNRRLKELGEQWQVNEKPMIER